MKQVLTVAGSDSGGGAGIQADLKTFHANGTFGMSVITSVTAQNTQAVVEAFDLPVKIVVSQIEAVFDDFEVSAVKTGMLSSSDIVEAVADSLRERAIINLVVDPVMVSKSGFSLLKEEAVECLKDKLLPLCRVLTPNIPEAELLTGRKVESVEDAKAAGKEILEMGPEAVLVKGGHLEDRRQSIDVLVEKEGETFFEAERIETGNTHGTGCTYSAAIAAHLGLGKSLKNAVGSAKEYVTKAILHSLSIGHGHGPTNHFFFLGK